MTELIKGADLKDVISITDTITNQLVDLSALPNIEVWYYTDQRTIIKFSRIVKAGYKLFTAIDSTHIAAYLETADTLKFKTGLLISDVYIATNNTDLTKGYFKNLGTKSLDISIIDKPISAV